MAVARSSAHPRGTRTPSVANKPPVERPELAEPEDVRDPTAPRRVVDHSLTRKQALASLVVTATGASDHLDPHPYLLRAAKNHGIATGQECPWCRSQDTLVHLHYVYGAELGPYAGRLKSPRELEQMATEHGQFRVYRVEVCIGCGWNHLLLSFVLGDGVPRAALRASRDMLD